MTMFYDDVCPQCGRYWCQRTGIREFSCVVPRAYEQAPKAPTKISTSFAVRFSWRQRLAILLRGWQTIRLEYMIDPPDARHTVSIAATEAFL